MLLFVLIGIIGLLIVALMITSIASENRTAQSGWNESADATYEKLKRERPDMEILKLGPNEFRMYFKSALQTRSQNRYYTWAPAIVLPLVAISFIVESGFDLFGFSALILTLIISTFLIKRNKEKESLDWIIQHIADESKLK